MAMQNGRNRLVFSYSYDIISGNLSYFMSYFLEQNPSHVCAPRDSGNPQIFLESDKKNEKVIIFFFEINCYKFICNN